MSAGSDSVKSILYALVANFAIAIAKLGAAVTTGSGAMMAEAIHSFADCTNQGLLLWGLRKAKQPPSQEHPLGYGKEIYFWSFIVALLLFSVGGLFSIYEGMHKLHDPQPLTWPSIAIGVLSFAIIAEGLSLWGCIKEINKTRGQLNLWQWFKSTRQSELMVIFGEDIAALVGLVLALVAVLAAVITGNPIYDAYGSIAIGALLIIIAIFIGIEVKQLLVGQGVEEPLREEMLSFLEQRDEVTTVYNLLTMQLGADVMVAIKAKMSADLNQADELISAINNIEVAFKRQFTQTQWLFFEPDNKD